MGFITDLPTTSKQHDSIMVMVDKLSKVAHFIPLNFTHKKDEVARIFTKELSRMHGLRKAIVYDRDTKFTSNFWRSIYQHLGTQLNFNITYHPQINGQTERVNQVIENILQMYVMDKPSKWKDYLLLVEFAYSNGHQASLNMRPFEVLYGRRCRTPVSWDNPVNREVIGLDILKDM